MTLMVRGISVLLAGFGLLSAAGGAVAESCPARPITLVVPFAPGGSASTAARAVVRRTYVLISPECICGNGPLWIMPSCSGPVMIV